MRPLQELNPARFETPAILKRLNAASRSLAELKGVIGTIPHQAILINTLGLQEAKDSSAIENIVTTHDELYREEAFPQIVNGVMAKEVHRYRQALGIGFALVRARGLITVNDLVSIQAELLGTGTGIRTLPGTVLRNAQNETVYTPPQDHSSIVSYLKDLEGFINDPSAFAADPLIKMALIHHQFESIHPFYDGNGRTGRMLNVLYLVKESLLNIPVLYLSRPLLRQKGEYYRLLQAVRDRDLWEDWVLYMLAAVESSAQDAITTTESIREALQSTKHQIRAQHKFYSQDLINTLFMHPYTKVEFLTETLGITRLTAAKYLEALVADGVLTKHKLGRSNYFLNTSLWTILTGSPLADEFA